MNKYSPEKLGCDFANTLDFRDSFLISTCKVKHLTSLKGKLSMNKLKVSQFAATNRFQLTSSQETSN